MIKFIKIGIKAIRVLNQRWNNQPQAKYNINDQTTNNKQNINDQINNNIEH